MSKNITINGKNYNGVSKINALVQGSTTEYAEFVDVDEVETGGNDVVLTTKTITANGTYSAADDNADGFSAVTVNVPTGGNTGEVANFPFPHNNIQTGSFTPTEDETSHSITCNFAPRGFMCIVADLDTNPPDNATQYSGIAWFYLENSVGGAFIGFRSGGRNKLPFNATADKSTKDGNTITIHGNVINDSQRILAGRTYNWVAWDY